MEGTDNVGRAAAYGELVSRFGEGRVADAIYAKYRDYPIPMKLSMDLLPSETEIYLTPRELDIITLIAAGLNKGEVAAELFIGIESVKSHSRNIRRKFKLRTMAGVVNKCWVLGYLG